MLVSFNIDYRTKWGETIWLNISESGAEPRLYMMTCTNGERWVLDMDIPSTTTQVEYFYELRQNEQVLSRGWGRRRTLNLDHSYQRYTLRDFWQGIPQNKTLFSSPFTDTFFHRNEPPVKSQPFKQAITIKVFAPAIQPNQRLYITGSSDVLGKWDINRAIPMSGCDFPEWSLTVNADVARIGDHYKFVVMENNKVVEWEQGDNRVWRRGAFESGEHVVYSGLHFNGGNLMWRGAGVAIPVFSLRSKTSYGIGDFDDLRKMADWAALTEQKVIQILPINDTTQTETWRDSYPYKSISIFALHPLYLSLHQMGKLSDSKLAASIEIERKRLNALPQVDYEGVGTLKWKFFKAIYKQEGAKTQQTQEYKDFCDANNDWLRPYAVFCYLRDQHGTADFSQWKEKYKKYSTQMIDTMSSPSFSDWDKVAIYIYLQYHLDKQLREAVKYCHQKNVVLKGDIPIGISRDSVEAWSEPHLFNMNGQAGAPPDDFSVMGQNWGFPTYNWEAMAKDGYAWWKRRFEKMADYFDLYRIDHILGFFRIWEIPMNSVQGLLGCFNPALPMSYDELSGWGLPMNRDRFLKPFIHYDFLGEFFGEYFNDSFQFLNDKGWGMYELKEDFDTQRKVQAYFEGKDDEKSNHLREALYGLINEVLFIEDPRQNGHFHPRITAQFTKSFQYLSDWEKNKFNEIYTHFFYKRHNDFWGALAMEKLPALIDATNMLCCAEDLGMIPDCVGKVMHDLSIITLEIQRMPKDPTVLFGDTNHYPYLSVCTTSTHDMATIRGWWREDKEKTQNYYNNVMHWYGEAPSEANEEICRTIIGNHLMSPSILSILPLQDWLSINERVRLADPDAERINVPANPDHYWRYRMHMTIEELLLASDFNKLVVEMTKGSGR